MYIFAILIASEVTAKSNCIQTMIMCRLNKTIHVLYLPFLMFRCLPYGFVGPCAGDNIYHTKSFLPLGSCKSTVHCNTFQILLNVHNLIIVMFGYLLLIHVLLGYVCCVWVHIVTTSSHITYNIKLYYTWFGLENIKVVQVSFHELTT